LTFLIFRQKARHPLLVPLRESELQERARLRGSRSGHRG
jgi:hypothetical protein